MHRRTATKVVGGRPQRKNNWDLTPNAYWGLPHIAIERERPGAGYRHLLSKRDIVGFLALLPDWDELSRDLNAVVLARGEFNTDGYCGRGYVAVCAWERDLWRWCDRGAYDEHRAIFERLGVRSERQRDGWGGCLVKWTQSQARAYQLLHVLLHEFGHHHDRITTRSRAVSARGERYAEAYALRYEARIWDAYAREFGLE